MSLFAGTDAGVYRASGPDGPFEHVLESGEVRRVLSTAAGLYAASESGLYRSPAGTDWTGLDTPRESVYAIARSPDGRYYIGTRPAHVYVSDDGGQNWRELTAIRTLPSQDSWYTPQDDATAQVSSLAIHADAPDRIFAGVERGGVYRSDDGGDTWTTQRDGIDEDVHHLLVVTPETVIASTGHGLYRTKDGAQSWVRLDGGHARSYFDEARLEDGILYTSAARGPPPSWDGPQGADAVLFESTDTGALAQVPSPTGTAELVHAWGVHDGTVIGGTNAGSILQRTARGWQHAAEIPASVRSFAVG